MILRTERFATTLGEMRVWNVSFALPGDDGRPAGDLAAGRFCPGYPNSTTD
jgi:hypothetical protein